MHRQAGELLRRLHIAAPPVPGGPGLDRSVQRVDEHLSRTGALLTSSEITLVRRRAAFAGAVRDLVRLEYGPWDQRPDLRACFLDGYGRALTHAEEQALPRLAALDALSGLQWGTVNGDRKVTGRARRTFARLRVRSPWGMMRLPAVHPSQLPYLH